jgi:hypothetical protein
MNSGAAIKSEKLSKLLGRGHGQKRRQKLLISLLMSLLKSLLLQTAEKLRHLTRNSLKRFTMVTIEKWI